MRLSLYALIACMAMVFPGGVLAQMEDIQWVGGNSGNAFSDPTNWSPNTAVLDAMIGQRLIFGDAATTFAPNVDTDVTNLGGILFNGGTSDFTFTGLPLSLQRDFDYYQPDRQLRIPPHRRHAQRDDRPN